jgi:hypothetical protein
MITPVFCDFYASSIRFLIRGKERSWFDGRCHLLTTRGGNGALIRRHRLTFLLPNKERREGRMRTHGNRTACLCKFHAPENSWIEIFLDSPKNHFSSPSLSE